MFINLSNQFFIVIGPGGRSDLYPFHPPNLPIVHAAHFKDLGLFKFFCASVLPSKVGLNVSMKSISSFSKTCTAGCCYPRSFFSQSRGMVDGLYPKQRFGRACPQNGDESPSTRGWLGLSLR
jgi:hypothetical protein